MKRAVHYRRTVAVLSVSLLLFLVLISVYSGNIASEHVQDIRGTRSSSKVDLYPGPKYPGCEPNTDVMTKRVNPGTTQMFNITVKNLGNTTDVIYLKVEGVPSGWKANLETPPDQGSPNPDYVRVDPGWQVNITLTVTAPWEGGLDDYAIINVTGNSSIEPLESDTITTFTRYYNFYDFDVSFTKEMDQSPGSPHESYKWDRIRPGEMAYEGLSIRNRGHCNDTYELTIDPVPAGWSAVFADTGTNSIEITLMTLLLEEYYADSIQTMLNVKITCPEDAVTTDEVIIHVTGVSVGSKAELPDPEERDDLLLMTVGSVHGIKVSCDDVQKEAAPNDTALYVIKVENLCNYEMTVVFSYEGLLDEWKITCFDERNLAVGESGYYTLMITPPAKWNGGEACITTITAKIKGCSHIQDSVTLTTIMKKVYDFDLEILKGNRTIDPGERTRFELAVKNRGNAVDTLDLSAIEVEDGLDVFFYKGDMRITSLDLMMDAITNFSVVVDTPDSIMAGKHPISIRLRGIDDTVTAELLLNVNRTYDLKVYPFPYSLQDEKPHRMFIDMTGGDENDFDIVVINDADYEDTTVLRIFGKHSGWGGEFLSLRTASEEPETTEQLDFHKSITVPDLNSIINYKAKPGTGDGNLTLTLDPGQSVYVKVRLWTPDKALPDSISCLSVLGDSRGYHDDDLLDNRAVFEITIEYPDMIVVNGVINVQTPRDRPEEGGPFRVFVNIRNVGDHDAGEFTVVLMVDGVEINRTIVASLPMYSPITVSFTWIAVRGEHVLTIKIDPEKRVLAPGQSRIYRRDIEIDRAWEPPSEEKNSSRSSLFLCVALLLLLLLIILMGVRMFFKTGNIDIQKRQP